MCLPVCLLLCSLVLFSALLCVVFLGPPRGRGGVEALRESYDYRFGIVLVVFGIAISNDVRYDYDMFGAVLCIVYCV